MNNNGPDCVWLQLHMPLVALPMCPRRMPRELFVRQYHSRRGHAAAAIATTICPPPNPRQLKVVSLSSTTLRYVNIDLRVALIDRYVFHYCYIVVSERIFA